MSGWYWSECRVFPQSPLTKRYRCLFDKVYSSTMQRRVTWPSKNSRILLTLNSPIIGISPTSSRRLSTFQAPCRGLYQTLGSVINHHKAKYVHYVVPSRTCIAVGANKYLVVYICLCRLVDLPFVSEFQRNMIYYLYACKFIRDTAFTQNDGKRVEQSVPFVRVGYSAKNTRLYAVSAAKLSMPTNVWRSEGKDTLERLRYFFLEASRCSLTPFWF